jgi:glucosyl-dolichyl phosphate glucuronosyltransferase
MGTTAQLRPMVSVVVCTYNRCLTLQRMLDSFFAQEGLGDVEHELLIIDNNSSDDTKAVTSRYLDRKQLRYVFEAEQGLSAARNRGVRESSGALIAFLDDDVIVSPKWLKEMATCFAQTSAGVIGGRATLLIECEQPNWLGPFFRTLLSEVDFGAKRVEVPDGVGLWGVNLAFEAEALRSVGCFDPKLGRHGANLLGGEEMEVVARLLERSARVVYEPAAHVEHIISSDRLKWDYFLRLARAAGATKQVREPQASLLWQLLRVLRSAQTVGVSQLLRGAAKVLGFTAYEQRHAQWNLVFAQSYLAMRWQCLVQRAPSTIRAQPRDA